MPHHSAVKADEPRTLAAAGQDFSPRGRRLSTLVQLVRDGSRRMRSWTPPAAAPPAQLMQQNGTGVVWANGAVIDHTQTLVIRGGGMPNAMNPETVAQRNPGVQKVGNGANAKWPAGLWTGVSVVSESAHLGGKAANVVIIVPDGLEIVQCVNDHHAEFRTTQACSNNEVSALLRGVKTTGSTDPQVAQLRARPASK
jgi:hypothetical protein